MRHKPHLPSLYPGNTYVFISIITLHNNANIIPNVYITMLSKMLLTAETHIL